MTAEKPAEYYATQLNTTGFTALVGVEFVQVDADRVELALPITEQLHQPYGIVHGGVYSTLVETAASLGAALWFGERGDVVGLQNTTHFLRAAREGTLHALATPIHRGRTQQLWLVEITDDARRLIARGEVRLTNLASADVLARPSAAGLAGGQ